MGDEIRCEGGVWEMRSSVKWSEGDEIRCEGGVWEMASGVKVE